MSDPSVSRELTRVGSAWWYVQVLRKNRRMLLIWGVVGGLLGLLNTLRERQYTARVRFRAITSSAVPMSALSAIGAQFGLSSLGSSTDAPEFYVNVLRSRDLLRELGNREYVVTSPRTFKGQLYGYFEIAEGDSVERNLKLVKALNGRIRTSVDRLTGLVLAEFNTNSRELSQAIAVSALDLLNEFDIQRRQAQARAEREFFEARLGAGRAALDEDENALARFYARNRQLMMGVRGSPELAAEEARLQRRVQLSQELFLGLHSSLSRVELDEARNTPTLAIVERPEGFVERRPRGTARLMVLLGLLGSAIAFGVALLREYRSMLRVA